MIKANELRIGNWINCHFMGLSFNAKVEDIAFTSNGYFAHVFYDGMNLEGYHTENIDPIPLTPEILEKAGFVWETTEKKHLELLLPEQGTNKRRISFFYLSGKCEMLQMYMDDYFQGYFEIKPPAYIHQLQNLYFALTSEELNIKL